MFGVSVFMSLALTATGFAAWVLSQDANVQDSGSVEVGAVTEANVEIKDLIFVDKDTLGNPVKNFVFEPLENDNVGRVQYDGKSKPENLKVTISWTISNYQNIDQHFIDLKIPASVKKAIDEKYIAVPEGFELQEGTVKVVDGDEEKIYYLARYTVPQNITADGETVDKLLSYTVTEESGVKTVVFTLKIKFGWGTDFGGINPAVYFDEDGASASNAEVKAILNEFKATVHGIEYTTDFESLTEAEKAELYEKNPIDKYYVVINATVK